MHGHKVLMPAESQGAHLCRSPGADVCRVTKWCCMQSHKVRRLDVADVAKLGRDNEQATSGQTIKQEDIKQEGIKQEDVKEEDVHTEDVKQQEVKQEGVKLEDIKQEGISQEPGSNKSSKRAMGPTGSSCHTSCSLCLARFHAAWH